MKAVGADERSGVDAARKRAVVETYVRNEAALRRTARRYSLCADDAEDALQRGLEILLRKAPTEDPRVLVKWAQTVVKHEAMAVRRDRERILAGPAGTAAGLAAEDWTALLPARSDGPPELAERHEALARGREALRALKPQELRALTLLAEGYSYAEIGEITGYSKTKVNRCLAEGRERFRRLVTSSEDGSRCAEMRPLLSAFCDGETTPQQADRLREHLRACAGCRATLRAYRAAPGAAAALAPLVPLDRSLPERVQDAFARLADRFERGGEALAQLPGGAGSAGLVKAAVVCVAGAGLLAGAGSGSLPFPATDVERRVEPPLESDATAASATDRVIEVGTPKAAGQPDLPRRRPRRRQAVSDPPEPPAEASPEAAGPAEYAPEATPEAVPEPSSPAPSAGAGSASPAGEFGP